MPCDSHCPVASSVTVGHASMQSTAQVCCCSLLLASHGSCIPNRLLIRSAPTSKPDTACQAVTARQSLSCIECSASQAVECALEEGPALLCKSIYLKLEATVALMASQLGLFYRGSDWPAGQHTCLPTPADTQEIAESSAVLMWARAAAVTAKCMVHAAELGDCMNMIYMHHQVTKSDGAYACCQMHVASAIGRKQPDLMRVARGHRRCRGPRAGVTLRKRWKLAPVSFLGNVC